jgi:hypothetical protein
MKTLILSCLATAAVLSFSACEADGEHRHHHTSGHGHRERTTTTTTEETTTRQPGSATTETRTIRSY